MQYTGNYQLKKPDGTDLVKISDLNENADIVDAELKKLANHATNKSNPHSITPLQIGAETPSGAQSKVDAHADRKDNPHAITRAQLGLANTLSVDGSNPLTLYLEDTGNALMPTKPRTSGPSSVQITLPLGTKQIQFIWSYTLSTGYLDETATISLLLDGVIIATASFTGTQPNQQTTTVTADFTSVVSCGPGTHTVGIITNCSSGSSASGQCDGVKQIGIGVNIV